MRILNRQYLRGHKLAIKMAHVHGLNLRMVVARRLLRNRHYNHIRSIIGVYIPIGFVVYVVDDVVDASAASVRLSRVATDDVVVDSY